MTISKRDVRLNTRAHEPARELFLGALNDSCRNEGWRPYEGLTNFLEMAYRATRRATLFGADIEKNEALYMKTVGRCRHAETPNEMARMLSAVVMALDAAAIDFVGPVFEEVAANQWGGQFFTPRELSKLIAELTFSATPPPTGRVIFCQEPACGVGGMVLAASEVLRERGYNLARDVHWQMVDVDARAIAGAYVQVTLCGISADVIHGNTLSLETWEGTRTMAAVLHPKRHARDIVIGEKPEPPQVEPTPTIQRPTQGDLFA